MVKPSYDKFTYIPIDDKKVIFIYTTKIIWALLVKTNQSGFKENNKPTNDRTCS